VCCSVHIDDNNVLSISGEQKQEHVAEAKNKRQPRVERATSGRNAISNEDKRD
jgi:hypothetical protein